MLEPALEWRQSRNPKDPTSPHQPILGRSAIIAGSYVAMQGVGYTDPLPDAFYPYVTYQKWLKEANKASAVPQRGILGQPFRVHSLHKKGAVRTEFFKVNFLADRKTRQQYLGFTDKNDHFSEPLKLVAPPGFFGRVKRFMLGGGPAAGRIEFELFASQDPTFTLELLKPGKEGTGEGISTVFDLMYAEASDMAADLGLDPSKARDVVNNFVADFVETETPAGWEVEIDSNQKREIYLDEGQSATVTINISCPTPGDTALALKAQTSDNEEIYSEIVFVSSTGEGISLPYADDIEVVPEGAPLGL